MELFHISTAAFCSSLLVFWVDVAVEADKTVCSLSPGLRRGLKTEPLRAMAAVFYLSA